MIYVLTWISVCVCVYYINLSTSSEIYHITTKISHGCADILHVSFCCRLQEQLRRIKRVQEKMKGDPGQGHSMLSHGHSIELERMPPEPPRSMKKKKPKKEIKKVLNLKVSRQD